jgi:hypothetical protein
MANDNRKCVRPTKLAGESPAQNYELLLAEAYAAVLNRSAWPDRFVYDAERRFRREGERLAANSRFSRMERQAH